MLQQYVRKGAVEMDIATIPENAGTRFYKGRKFGEI